MQTQPVSHICLHCDAWKNVGRRKPSELLEVNGIVYFMCLNTLVTRTSSVHRDGRTFRVCKEEQNKAMVFMKLLRNMVLYFGAHIIVDATGSCLGMAKENRGWPGIHAFTIKEQTPFTLALFCCGGNTWRSNKCKKFLTQDQYMKKTWEAYGRLIS